MYIFSLPLHPIAVHFPLALGLLLPFVAFFVHLGIKKNIFSSKAWVLVSIMSAITFISGWISLKLGEWDEEKVDMLVDEVFIRAHESDSEMFFWFSVVALVASTLPLLTKNEKKWRILSILVFLAAIPSVIFVGNSGGDLVYKYGAADVFKLDKETSNSNRDVEIEKQYGEERELDDN